MYIDFLMCLHFLHTFSVILSLIYHFCLSVNIHLHSYIQVTKYEKYLRSDDLISHQLDELYQKMLELNLLKIVHPYSCVEISHVAKKIKLPEVDVERKLSQMILDRRFSGILDQGKGHLIIYENSSEDKAYTKGLEVISNIGQVVDALFSRAKALEKTA